MRRSLRSRRSQARSGSKKIEFCIKNEEFCIKNEGLCIKNDELCIVMCDGFCRWAGVRDAQSALDLAKQQIANATTDEERLMAQGAIFSIKTTDFPF